MQVIITDAWMAKTRAFHFSGAKLVLVILALSFALMVISAGMYHWVF